jgi:hypothetical protein
MDQLESSRARAHNDAPELRALDALIEPHYHKLFPNAHINGIWTHSIRPMCARLLIRIQNKQMVDDLLTDFFVTIRKSENESNVHLSDLKTFLKSWIHDCLLKFPMTSDRANEIIAYCSNAAVRAQNEAPEELKELDASIKKNFHEFTQNERLNILWTKSIRPLCATLLSRIRNQKNVDTLLRDLYIALRNPNEEYTEPLAHLQETIVDPWIYHCLVKIPMDPARVHERIEYGHYLAKAALHHAAAHVSNTHLSNHNAHSQPYIPDARAYLFIMRRNMMGSSTYEVLIQRTSEKKLTLPTIRTNILHDKRFEWTALRDHDETAQYVGVTFLTNTRTRADRLGGTPLTYSGEWHDLIDFVIQIEHTPKSYDKKILVHMENTIGVYLEEKHKDICAAIEEVRAERNESFEQIRADIIAHHGHRIQWDEPSHPRSIVRPPGWNTRYIKPIYKWFMDEGGSLSNPRINAARR